MVCFPAPLLHSRHSRQPSRRLRTSFLVPSKSVLSVLSVLVPLEFLILLPHSSSLKTFFSWWFPAGCLVSLFPERVFAVFLKNLSWCCLAMALT